MISLTRRHFVLGTSSLALLALAQRANPASSLGARAEAHIEALIAKMTLQEKAGQLSIFSDMTRLVPKTQINPEAGPPVDTNLAQRVREGRLIGVFNGLGAAGARAIQKIAVEESRLKIPLIFGADVLHGLYTIFPIPLGEAASFDPQLAERTARAAAIESTANGLHWTFAPMVDIGRDQRWGRVAEGSGEDPYLGTALAVARVRGFQGKNLTDEDSMLACPKHFVAYGAASGGMDYNSVEMSEQTLHEVYLAPFKAAFEAGALSTMSSFNDVNGVPMSANRKLMTELLREEWRFRGMVVSDYTADKELIAHGVANDDREATKLAILAGVDISMQSDLYNLYLPELVKSGDLAMAVVDESVRRVLRTKYVLGLFDNPYRSLNPKVEKRNTMTPQLRAIARESARASIVLMKNEGELLPLRKSGQKIALIGPFGPDTLNLAGPWAPFANFNHVVSVEQGLRAALTDPSLLTVTQGSLIEKPLEGGIDAAVAAASAADVVVLAIGEGQNMSGEGNSRTRIDVPAPQQQLAEAVAKVGKPIVVLLRNGRALALEGAVREAQAIVTTWFLGTETGSAIADVLFGDYSPSGRLPVSFPQDSGQQPYFYNRRTTGRPQGDQGPAYKARYREVSNEALYSFGHGLTYSRFDYEPPIVSTDSLGWNEVLTVTAKITNIGEREAEEVAQLYIRDRTASLTRPIRELKGFRKVRIAPGTSAEVQFTLTRTDLAFYNAAMKFVAEPGEFDVWISPSATTGVSTRFELKGA
ncbi:MAG: glycoside hydrolase family 3 C-terminal domain-containing protein [Steroidobacter sp.]|nr:glycoside hydrolase family 3 N-terminal domain-containing protein [Steroidobacter sp.]MBL8269935.1 glycoside hydrolase family 3 C-terminal domain-containing protein [Steroidobacter sp.]